jgi:trimeric autotransporter adhesin
VKRNKTGFNTLDHFHSGCEAARTLGVGPDHISRLCRAGALECRKFGGTWHVTRASLRRRVRGHDSPASNAPSAGPSGQGGYIAAGLLVITAVLVAANAVIFLGADRIAARLASPSELSVQVNRSTDWFSAPSHEHTTTTHVRQLASAAASADDLFGVEGYMQFNAEAPTSAAAVSADDVTPPPANQSPSTSLAFAADEHSPSSAGGQPDIRSANSPPAAPLAAPAGQLTVSASWLTDQLKALRNELRAELHTGSAKVPALTFSGPPETTPATFQALALSSKIDQLSGTAIKDPTISGGTISDTAIGATSLTVSGDLTVQGAQALSGALTVPHIIATSAEADSIFVRLTATSATTTNASSTNLYAATLTADVGSVGALTSSNATITNATSTTLFAALGRFTTGIIDALTAAVATIEDLTATTIVAENATTTTLAAEDLTVSGTTQLASLSAATTTLTSLTVSGPATLNSLAVSASFTGAGLAACSDPVADKLLYNAATGQFICGTDQIAEPGSGSNWTVFGSGAGLRPGNVSQQVLIGAGATTTLAKLEVQGGAFLDQATTTALGLGGTTFTDLLGTGLANTAGALTVTLSPFDTDELAEGTNLYFTTARARDAVSTDAEGLTYATTTGVLSLDSSYTIPLIASTTDWNAFFNTPSTRITAGTGLTWSANALNASLGEFDTGDLAEGTNLYWTNARFDERLSATTTLPNLTSLANLATVGTITTGTWQGSTIGVAHGGTGATTLTGLLQGNGTGAITAVAGTAGQFPYYSGTNTLAATSSIFLAESGNVGIGTTTPRSRLSIVRGNPPGSEDLAGVGLFSGGNSNFTAFALGRVSPDGFLAVAGASNNYMTGSGQGDSMLIGTTGKLHLATGPLSAVQGLTVAAGNVGIGTTDPKTKLNVRGASGITSFTGTTFLGAVIGGATSSNDYSGLDFKTAG